MHPEAVFTPTRRCLELLAKEPWLKKFYLAGGTGLALHLGHRYSDDLDFFSPKEVEPKRLRFFLSQLGSLKIEMEKEGTLWATLDKTKISFFHYDYPMIDKKHTLRGLPIAGIKDIACMKLDTISSRGSRKDFIDLYFILKEGHLLQDLLNWFRKKYAGVQFNQVHLLKSLTYFDDAESEGMPKMLRKCDWDTLKCSLVAESKKIVFPR